MATETAVMASETEIANAMAGLLDQRQQNVCKL